MMLWEILRVEATHFPRYFLGKQVVCVCVLVVPIRLLEHSADGKN